MGQPDLSVLLYGACVASVGLFVMFCLLFAYTVKQSDESEPELLLWISACTSASFATTAFIELVGMATRRVESIFLVTRGHRSNPSDTLPISLCVVTINVIACTTHLMMATEAMPNVIGLGKRRYSLARWAEWCSLTPLLMTLIHSYDAETGELPKKDEIVSHPHDDRKKTKSLLPPTRLSRLAINSIQNQSLCTLLGAIASIYDMPRWLAVVLLAASCGFHCNIYYVIGRSYHKLKPSLQSHKVHVAPTAQNAQGELAKFLPIVLNGEDNSSHLTLEAYSSMYCRNDRRIRAFFLVNVCMIIWTFVAINYFLGLAGVYSNLTESIISTFSDIVSKNVFVCMLGQAKINLAAETNALHAILEIEVKATRLRREFLRYVMHEVRVPLNAVKLGLSAIADSVHESNSSVSTTTSGETTCDIDDVVTMVNRSIENMSETLNDVLSFAAIEEGKFQLNYDFFSISDMLSAVTAAHTPTAAEKKILLKTSIDDKLARVLVYGDCRRIGSCVSNFVSNALKFNRSGIEKCQVEVIATSSPPSLGHGVDVNHSKAKDKTNDDRPAPSSLDVVIKVKDNGIGLSKADASKLFQAFSQIRPSELQQGRGSGLGLAIAKQIVQHHGGSIGVNSELGVGSEFYMRLHLEAIENNKPNSNVVVDKSDADSYVFRSSSSTSEVGETTPPCALVVDDSSANRRLFGMQVKKLGFRVSEAENGAEAVRACGVDPETGELIDPSPNSESYDIVFMDSVMPVMNGIDATKKLRVAGKSDLLIFGVTGNALEEDIREFTDAGANSVLTKPVSRQKLRNELTRFRLLVSC